MTFTNARLYLLKQLEKLTPAGIILSLLLVSATSMAGGPALSDGPGGWGFEGSDGFKASFQTFFKGRNCSLSSSAKNSAHLNKSDLAKINQNKVTIQTFVQLIQATHPERIDEMIHYLQSLQYFVINEAQVPLSEGERACALEIIQEFLRSK